STPIWPPIAPAHRDAGAYEHFANVRAAHSDVGKRPAKAVLAVALDFKPLAFNQVDQCHRGDVGQATLRVATRTTVRFRCINVDDADALGTEAERIPIDHADFGGGNVVHLNAPAAGRRP